MATTSDAKHRPHELGVTTRGARGLHAALPRERQTASEPPMGMRCKSSWIASFTRDASKNWKEGKEGRLRLRPRPYHEISLCCPHTGRVAQTRHHHHRDFRHGTYTTISSAGSPLIDTLRT